MSTRKPRIRLTLAIPSGTLATVPPSYVILWEKMPTLKDVLNRLSNRREVEAVFAVGKDGLLIDQAGSDGADGEAVAAMAPSLLNTARELGSAARHDGLQTAVIEYSDGVAIVADVSQEMILVTFVRPGVPFGDLLYQIRHNRQQIAKLI